ncbi:hypothetical protein F4780DRAFT_778221 [Xylariomycetidae sp. FL0641]|nr:hypothetical protein F4780DRAFT_778221 [Xylariomycetidae sp. FL0641]
MNASKAKHEEEELAFLSSSSAVHSDAVWSRPPSGYRKWLGRLRTVMELAMAGVIVCLLVLLSNALENVDESPVPRFPRKTYKFLPDPQFVRDDMFFDEHDTMHTLHNWIPLSADGRGYVQIPDHEAYEQLGEPYTVTVNRTSDGPAYMMSVFHQLHCLSYLASHYQKGYGGANLTEEVAHHSAHCFDYIRQSIMCAGDTNLEGDTETGPGWGSDHTCVDYEAMLDWANEHSLFDLSGQAFETNWLTQMSQ